MDALSRMCASTSGPVGKHSNPIRFMIKGAPLAMESSSPVKTKTVRTRKKSPKAQKSQSATTKSLWSNALRQLESANPTISSDLSSTSGSNAQEASPVHATRPTASAKNAAHIDIIAQYHNDTLGNHGVEMTTRSIRDAGHYWKGLRTHVKAFLKPCVPCQLVNPNKRPYHGHSLTTITSRPFQRVAIDCRTP